MSDLLFGINISLIDLVDFFLYILENLECAHEIPLIFIDFCNKRISVSDA